MRRSVDRLQGEADFIRLVSESTERLLRTAYLLCGDLTEAEDLIQETWTRMARRWRSLHGIDNPGAYARRVLVNLVIDGAWQRSRRRIELACSPEYVANRTIDTRSERLLRSVEASDALAAALAELTPRQRAVVVLRYWDDQSEQHTARALGCSVGTVKSTASKALAQLRARLVESELVQQKEHTA